MLLPAQQPMAGAELRQRIAEQLGLAADLAEQLRLVHQGKEVGHGDMVAPVPNDEVVAAILPRGCDLRQATAINSPPTDGSPGKPEQPTGRMKRRRRADGERSNAPGNCKAISASDGVAVARVATFRTVPSAVQHDFAWRVMRVVEAIPPGKVAAYGQVARYAGAPRNARQVGKLLGTVLSGGIVPWQRVINASGRISLPADSGGDRQRRLLNAEGVRFKNLLRPLYQKPSGLLTTPPSDHFSVLGTKNLLACQRMNAYRCPEKARPGRSGPCARLPCRQD